MKLLVGVAMWLAVLALAVLQWPRTEQARRSLTETAVSLWSKPPELRLATAPGISLVPGQSLVMACGDDVQRVGEVISGAGGGEAVARIDPRYRELMRDDTTFTYYDGAGSLWWALRTLLPQGTRDRIHAEYQAFMARHFAELRALLEPMVIQTLDQLATLLKEDLERVVNAHKAELEHLGARYRDEIFRAEVLPLLKEEIWPIIRRHGAGPAEVIGRELWAHLPLWGLTWRAFYDSMAHDTPEMVERRWLEFVREDAIPVLMSRMDVLLSLAIDVMRDIAHSPEVDATARKILVKLKDDPEFLALAQAILRDLFRDNERLHAFLRAKWEDAEVRSVVAQAGQRIEGLLRRIGDMVLLNEQRTGISPHLARVLRSVVLRKDRAYIVVESGHGNLLPLGSRVELRHAP